MIDDIYEEATNFVASLEEIDIFQYVEVHDETFLEHVESDCKSIIKYFKKKYHDVVEHFKF